MLFFSILCIRRLKTGLRNLPFNFVPKAKRSRVTGALKRSRKMSVTCVNMQISIPQFRLRLLGLIPRPQLRNEETREVGHEYHSCYYVSVTSTYLIFLLHVLWFQRMDHSSISTMCLANIHVSSYVNEGSELPSEFRVYSMQL